MNQAVLTRAGPYQKVHILPRLQFCSPKFGTSRSMSLQIHLSCVLSTAALLHHCTSIKKHPVHPSALILLSYCFLLHCHEHYLKVLKRLFKEYAAEFDLSGTSFLIYFYLFIAPSGSPSCSLPREKL